MGPRDRRCAASVDDGLVGRAAKGTVGEGGSCVAPLPQRARRRIWQAKSLLASLPARGRADCGLSKYSHPASPRSGGGARPRRVSALNDYVQPLTCVAVRTSSSSLF